MVFLRVLLDFFSIVRPRGVFFLSFFVDFFALLGLPAVIDFSWLRKSLLPCYFLLRTSVCAIRESDQLSVKKNEGILPAGRSTAHPEPCLPDWCGSNPPVRASRISLIRRDDGVVDIQRREREREIDRIEIYAQRWPLICAEPSQGNPRRGSAVVGVATPASDQRN